MSQECPEHVLLTQRKSPALRGETGLEVLVGAIGLEPTTPTMSRWCSNQLSYAPEFVFEPAIVAERTGRLAARAPSATLCQVNAAWPSARRSRPRRSPAPSSGAPSR